MAEKVLIYAGTTEGRLLAQELSRAHIACDVHVATEYGQMVMPELAGVKVCVGRLDVEEMRALLKKKRTEQLCGGRGCYASVCHRSVCQHPGEYKRKWNSISAAPAANGRWNL